MKKERKNNKVQFLFDIASFSLAMNIVIVIKLLSVVVVVFVFRCVCVCVFFLEYADCESDYALAIAYHRRR